MEQQGEMMEESLERVVEDLDWLVEKQEKRNQISFQGSGPLQKRRLMGATELRWQHQYLKLLSPGTLTLVYVLSTLDGTS